MQNQFKEILDGLKSHNQSNAERRIRDEAIDYDKGKHASAIAQGLLDNQTKTNINLVSNIMHALQSEENRKQQEKHHGQNMTAKQAELIMKQLEKSNEKKDKVYSKNQDKAEKIYNEFIEKHDGIFNVFSQLEIAKKLILSGNGRGYEALEAIKIPMRAVEAIGGGRVSIAQYPEVNLALEYSSSMLDKMIRKGENIGNKKELLSTPEFMKMMENFEESLGVVAKRFNEHLLPRYQKEFTKLNPHLQNSETFEWDKWDAEFTPIKYGNTGQEQIPTKLDNNGVNSPDINSKLNSQIPSQPQEKQENILQKISSSLTPEPNKDGSMLRRMQEAMFPTLKKEELDRSNRSVQNVQDDVNAWKLLGKDTNPEKEKNWENYAMNAYGAATDPTNFIAGGLSRLSKAPALTKNMSVGAGLGMAHDLKETGEVGAGTALGAALPAGLHGVGKGLGKLFANNSGTEKERILNALGAKHGVMPDDIVTKGIEKQYNAHKATSQDLYNQAFGNNKVRVKGSLESIAKQQNTLAQLGIDYNKTLPELQQELGHIKTEIRRLTKQRSSTANPLSYKEYQQQLVPLKEAEAILENVMQSSATSPKSLNTANQYFKENIVPYRHLKETSKAINPNNKEIQNSISKRILGDTEGFGSAIMNQLPQEAKNQTVLQHLIGSGQKYYPNSSSFSGRATSLPEKGLQGLTPEAQKLVKDYANNYKEYGILRKHALGGLIGGALGYGSSGLGGAGMGASLGATISPYLERSLNRMFAKYPASTFNMRYLKGASPYIGSKALSMQNSD